MPWPVNPPSPSNGRRTIHPIHLAHSDIPPALRLASLLTMTSGKLLTLSELPVPRVKSQSIRAPHFLSFCEDKTRQYIQSLAHGECSVNILLNCHRCGCKVLGKIKVESVFRSLMRTPKEKGWGFTETLNGFELG